ncbi:hypothetical protein N7510_001743 [Penicillium lagena]|uniref:uncharacterized protein n=1 Tax=Penicillium lagena TaxID=94218 RepID=UPI0025412706|nr:uncharacterized protein N7510_001743 [Penicillium lagena]KAJ5625434.1 hypothetical protein N7510_001743 [Penicillium lagena]
MSDPAHPKITRTVHPGLPGLGLPLTFRPQNKVIEKKLKKKKAEKVWQVEQNVKTIDDSTACASVSLLPSLLDMPLNWTLLPPLMLREITMIRAMNEFTDSPDWSIKGEITSTAFTEKMFDYCVKELRYHTARFWRTGMIFGAMGIVKSDTAVPGHVKTALIRASRVLEDDASVKHSLPKSCDDKVVNLVDPSLFPLIFGRTRAVREDELCRDHCLSDMGKGEIVSIPSIPEMEDFVKKLSLTKSRFVDSYNTKMQWIPCDVLVSPHGCSIHSYINNVHPEHHEDLYRVVEDIMDIAVPVWGHSLGLSHQLTDLHDHGYYLETRIDWKNSINQSQLPNQQKPRKQKGESNDHFRLRLRMWESGEREPGMPDAPNFNENDHPVFPPSHLQCEFSKLQVFVKLVNINLSPENPTYDGEKWHVDGQPVRVPWLSLITSDPMLILHQNEHICATALYYYDSDNITESRLSFRQGSWFSMHYEELEDFFESLPEMFGCKNGDPQVQEIGEVLCRPGRLVTFPSVYQYRANAFRLSDPTKPGHLKMLALFLVDPMIRLISTSQVPPQREDWWHELIGAPSGKGLSRLPNEIKSQVIEEVGYPITMREAQKLRQELAAQREEYVQKSTKNFEKFRLALGTTFDETSSMEADQVWDDDDEDDEDDEDNEDDEDDDDEDDDDEDDDDEDDDDEDDDDEDDDDEDDDDEDDDDEDDDDERMSDSGEDQE